MNIKYINSIRFARSHQPLSQPVNPPTQNILIQLLGKITSEPCVFDAINNTNELSPELLEHRPKHYKKAISQNTNKQTQLEDL